MQSTLLVGSQGSQSAFSRTFIHAAAHSYYAFRFKYLSAAQTLTITFVDSSGNTDLTALVSLNEATSLTAIDIQNIDIATLTADTYTVNYSFGVFTQFNEHCILLSETEVS